MDGHGNGRVREREFDRAQEAPDGTIEGSYDHLNRDDDGEVSYSELKRNAKQSLDRDDLNSSSKLSMADIADIFDGLKFIPDAAEDAADTILGKQESIEFGDFAAELGIKGVRGGADFETFEANMEDLGLPGEEK